MRLSLLCIVFGLLIANGTCSTKQRIEISEAEDLELERQLKVLNKQPVKSFQGEGNRIIDCIEITKQLAFDHPLLKNHTIQMRPSSVPKLRTANPGSILRRRPRSRINCPLGTVPVPRITKDELIIRSKMFPGNVKHHANARLLSEDVEGNFFATAETTIDQFAPKRYYGARGQISVFNVSVADDQFSGAFFWFQRSVDSPLNSIQYGWEVNPKLYGDKLARTVSYWTADGFQKTGCYNSLCPGFVQVDQRYHIGDIITPAAVFGGPQTILDIFIIEDNAKNWWVSETLGDGTVVQYGYWPSSIVTGMADGATEVKVGGVVYTPDQDHAPAMGSGSFNPPVIQETAFVGNIQFVNSLRTFFSPENETWKVFASQAQCWQAAYPQFVQELSGYSFFYGGRGGKC